jgi:hypothetical protein
LTEVFAAALDAHQLFCRKVVTETGARAEAASFEVTTQQGFDRHPRLVDVVINCHDADGDVVATVFVENKYNPRRMIEPHWFSLDQAKRQAAALKRQAASDS